MIEHNDFAYHPCDDSLEYHPEGSSLIVYQQGTWAEVVKEEKKVTLEEYKNAVRNYGYWINGENDSTFEERMEELMKTINTYEQQNNLK